MQQHIKVAGQLPVLGCRTSHNSPADISAAKKGEITITHASSKRTDASPRYSVATSLRETETTAVHLLDGRRLQMNECLT